MFPHPLFACGEEASLQQIADIVGGYEASIDTIELRTSTSVSEQAGFRKARAAMPGLWGSDIVVREEYGRAGNQRRYHKTVVEKAGSVKERSEDYKDASTAYKLARSTSDPNLVTHAYISRNYRLEKSRLSAAPELLKGLMPLDCRTLHEALRAPETVLIGRRTIDGVDCYHIRVTLQAGMSHTADYFLDPTHDYLCRQLNLYSANNELQDSWRTIKFASHESRWFPDAVARDVFRPVDGKWTNVSTFFTQVEELRINRPIPSSAFRPIIPPGTHVEDNTQDVPTSYIQGSVVAPPADQAMGGGTMLGESVSNEPPPDKRIVVEPGRDWSVWAASIGCVVSGVILVLAILRVRGQ
jgi:hypothetical protein